MQLAHGVLVCVAKSGQGEAGLGMYTGKWPLGHLFHPRAPGPGCSLSLNLLRPVFSRADKQLFPA